MASTDQAAVKEGFVVPDKFKPEQYGLPKDYALPVLSPKQRVFLERIDRWDETISEACEVTKIPRLVVEEWKKEPAFARVLQLALQDRVDRLEKALWHRAVHGVEEPCFYQGVAGDTKTVYSDAAATFLLKGLRPETYGDKLKVEKEPPQPLVSAEALSKLDDEQLDLLLATLGQLGLGAEFGLFKKDGE